MKLRNKITLVHHKIMVIREDLNELFYGMVHMISMSNFLLKSSQRLNYVLVITT